MDSPKPGPEVQALHSCLKRTQKPHKLPLGKQHLQVSWQAEGTLHSQYVYEVEADFALIEFPSANATVAGLVDPKSKKSNEKGEA
eukprot:6487132-Amphidinium_carterae.1